ncbi:hypothetical protein BDN72DRAFT_153405 [Pluteus cervinus]|uniref:Uncharacterized protein n=1 Tax=Pluteus cervinus TaxID=181527 RepID=A0ACD3ALB6_9AGAR|nr:hypothetical protein BDN72DRAFT_153405 [Pluteus cervinus]
MAFNSNWAPPPAVDVTDALNFIDAVRTRCPPIIYDQFLDLMRIFRSREIDANEVVEQIVQLFDGCGQTDLVRQFTIFVPPGQAQRLEYDEYIDPHTKAKLIQITTPEGTRIARKVPYAEGNGM